MPTTNYWNKLSLLLPKTIPENCRVGKAYFTSVVIIGGKLYSTHPKNMKHVHKYIKDMLSDIITPGNHVSDRHTIFMIEC